MNSLFIYNPQDLNSKILGGVQICSKEYLSVIECFSDELSMFPVTISTAISFRLSRKINIDSYQAYNTKNYKKALRDIILIRKISYVFINRCDLLKFSKLVKSIAKNDQIEIKVIILSHGNESGDLLHDISRPNPRYKGWKNFLGKFKLGRNIVDESHYRHLYVDYVCTISEEEMYIEKWLGAKQVFFLPRILSPNIIEWKPKPNLVGYVGTLNHTPNLEAITQIFDEFEKRNITHINIRLVGQPQSVGQILQSKYKFVTYLGPLEEKELMEELRNWSLFLNPVFWYSKGSSMKLGMALNLGIPIISTKAGKRGYKWKNGNICITENDVFDFTNKLIELLSKEDEILSLRASVLKIIFNPIQIRELACSLKQELTQS